MNIENIVNLLGPSELLSAVKVGRNTGYTFRSPKFATASIPTNLPSASKSCAPFGFSSLEKSLKVFAGLAQSVSETDECKFMCICAKT